MMLKTPSLLDLQKGQLWKTKTGNVEIMEVGKLLTHCRLFVDGQKRIPTKMERISVVQAYLKANGGKLVTNDRVAASPRPVVKSGLHPMRFVG